MCNSWSSPGSVVVYVGSGIAEVWLMLLLPPLPVAIMRDGASRTPCLVMAKGTQGKLFGCEKRGMKSRARAAFDTATGALLNLAQIDTPYLSPTSSGLTYMTERFKRFVHGGSVQLNGVPRSLLAEYAESFL